MSNSQIVIIIFITVVMVLAIWNLVLSIQSIKNEKTFNKYKEMIKKTNEEEKKKDYYGRLK